MMRKRGLVLAALLGSAAMACSPTIRQHGYAPDEALLAEVQVGQDTRASVAEKIGRPVTDSLFDDDGWYYVSTTLEHETYHDPRVIDRRIVAVTFDESDVVADISTYGIEDGRVIDLATRTTPTHGRELTILQQVLGNIGRITGEDLQEIQE